MTVDIAAIRERLETWDRQVGLEPGNWHNFVSDTDVEKMVDEIEALRAEVALLKRNFRAQDDDPSVSYSTDTIG